MRWRACRWRDGKVCRNRKLETRFQMSDLSDQAMGSSSNFTRGLMRDPRPPLEGEEAGPRVRQRHERGLARLKPRPCIGERNGRHWRAARRLKGRTWLELVRRLFELFAHGWELQFCF